MIKKNLHKGSGQKLKRKTGQADQMLMSIFIFAIFHFLSFLAVLGHFWVVLGEPVTYMITRGIELVVGRVTALRGFRRVWRGFGWSRGGQVLLVPQQSRSRV